MRLYLTIDKGGAALWAKKPNLCGDKVVRQSPPAVYNRCRVEGRDRSKKYLCAAAH